MIQSIVNFVFLASSRTNRAKLANPKWLPYSDGFGVKKKRTFLVMLYNYSSKYKLHLSIFYPHSHRKSVRIRQT